MARTGRIEVRVDAEVKKKTMAIFKSLGLSFSDGVSLYLQQVIRHRGIPFELTLADRKTKLEFTNEAPDEPGQYLLSLPSLHEHKIISLDFDAEDIKKYKGSHQFENERWCKVEYNLDGN